MQLLKQLSEIGNFILVCIVCVGATGTGIVHIVKYFKARKENPTGENATPSAFWVPTCFVLLGVGVLYFYIHLFIPVNQSKKTPADSEDTSIQLQQQMVRRKFLLDVECICVSGSLHYLIPSSELLFSTTSIEERREFNRNEPILMRNMKRICDDSLYVSFKKCSYKERKIFLWNVGHLEIDKVAIIDNLNFACPLADSSWVVFGSVKGKLKLIRISPSKPDIRYESPEFKWGKFYKFDPEWE